MGGGRRRGAKVMVLKVRWVEEESSRMEEGEIGEVWREGRFDSK